MAEVLKFSPRREVLEEAADAIDLELPNLMDKAKTRAEETGLELRAEPGYKPNSGWVAGRVRCLACKYEWIGVAPSGSIDLDCPNCGCYRGTWKSPTVPPDDDAVYTCSCGCAVFHAVRTTEKVHYLLCLSCGAQRMPWAKED